MKMGIYIGDQLALAVMLTPLLCLGSVLSPMVANATVYYVATTGNDSVTCNNSKSISTPKQTIQSGIGCLSAGDTLYIRQGTYSEQIDTALYTIPSGTSTNRITIAGYPAETVILTGGITLNTGAGVSYLTFDNLVIDANPQDRGLYIGSDTANQHIRFSNGEIKGARCMNGAGMVAGKGDYFEMLNSKIHDAGTGTTRFPQGCYGFYMTGSNGLYDRNQVYNNAGYGFNIYHSGGNDVNNNIVRNNIIYGNGFNDGVRGSATGGLLLASGSNNIAYNNIVYGNAGPGITVSYAILGYNNIIYNNNVYNNGKSGFPGCCYAGIFFSNAPNTVIQNNISFGNGIDSVYDGGEHQGVSYRTTSRHYPWEHSVILTSHR